MSVHEYVSGCVSVCARMCDYVCVINQLELYVGHPHSKLGGSTHLSPLPPRPLTSVPLHLSAHVILSQYHDAGEKECHNRLVRMHTQ